MSQNQIIVLVLKIGLASGFFSIVASIAHYSRIAKWWRNPVGRNVVTNAALIAGLLVPTAMSLYLGLNRETSLVVAWADVALIWLITPVMVWRMSVWRAFGGHRKEPQTRKIRMPRQRVSSDSESRDDRR